MIRLLQGLVLGISNIIPGISAGSMALVMGIYEPLIQAIRFYALERVQMLKAVKLLLVIASGAGFGIFLLAKGISFVLEDALYSQMLYMTIVGLIIGSIPFILTLHKDMKPSLKRLLSLLIALGIAVLIAFLGVGETSTSAHEQVKPFLGIFAYRTFDFMDTLWLMVCGMLAAGAMVLPGISGSALMVSLGQYDEVLYIISERLMIEAFFLGIGVILGMIVFSKLVSHSLKHYPAVTYYMVIGLLLASIYQIVLQLNQSIQQTFFTILMSILCLVSGFGIAYLFSKVSLSSPKSGRE